MQSSREEVREARRVNRRTKSSNSVKGEAATNEQHKSTSTQSTVPRFDAAATRTTSPSKTLRNIIDSNQQEMTPRELLREMRRERRRVLMTARNASDHHSNHYYHHHHHHDHTSSRDDRERAVTVAERPEHSAPAPTKTMPVPAQQDKDRSHSAESEVATVVDRAVRLFNEKAQKGVEEMIKSGVISRVPGEVANFLIDTEGLSRKQLGLYLGSPDEFNRKVLDEFVDLFSFEGLELDDALRVFFVSFALPGEAQIIERIMECFSKHYAKCNTGTALGNPDTTFVLSFSLIMLNTDLHTPEVKNKMTREQFVKNFQGVSDGEEKIPREVLINLYDKIKRNELKLVSDESEYLSLFLRPERQGWLTKEGGRTKTWKRRWFKLKSSMLFYFHDPQDQVPLGTIPLTDVHVRPFRGKPFAFELCSTNGGRITSSKRNNDGMLVMGQHDRFVCAAESEDECNAWLRKLHQSILLTSTSSVDQGDVETLSSAFGAAACDSSDDGNNTKTESTTKTSARSQKT